MLDSIFTLFGSLTEKEIDAWTQVADWLATHQDAGRAFILVHHDSKGQARNAWCTVMRSVRVDIQISFARVTVTGEDEDIEQEGIEVQFLKHRETAAENVRPFVFFTDLVDDHWVWRWQEKTKGLKVTPRRRAADERNNLIVEMLSEGKTKVEVAEELGVSVQWVRRIAGKAPNLTRMKPDLHMVS